MIQNPRTFALLALALLAACAKHSGSAAGVQPLTTPAFETRSEILTGTGSHSDFAVVDLNGDGQLDMAVAGLTGELQIMLGSGGNFSVGQSLSVGGGPIWLANADLDRDGDRDLVVVRISGGDAAVLLNDGHANFSAGQILPVGPEALAVVVGDANDDGLLDVVVSRMRSPEIVVHNGDGSGAFTAGTAFVMPGGGRPIGIHTGDVTRDVLPDLIVCDVAGERVLIYPGRSSNDFDPNPIELPVDGQPAAASIGDLNSDGWNDICVSAFARSSFVVIDSFTTGPGYSFFEVPADGPPSLSTIGDATGDGLNDLVGCLRGRAGVAIFPQIPSGGFGEAFQLESTGMPLRPVLGDVDLNGRTDLLVLSGLGDRINLWRATTDGRLVGARSYETGLQASSWITGGDFDRDGDPDVVVAGNDSSRVVFMSARADGALAVVHTVDVERSVFNVEAADMDADGRLDVVVPVAGGVKILRNRGAVGTFDFEVLPGPGGAVFGSGIGLFGVAVADLDRDGSLDLAVVDYQAGNLQILHGTVDPFVFDPAHVLSVGGGPVDVAAADFDADGLLDLAVSRSTRADIAVFRNTGTDLVPFLDVPVGSAPNYLITGDFNRDRRADLVVSNGNDSSISVLFARQGGFSSSTYPAGLAPTALLARDLTNDGIDDILVASLSGGDFRVLIGDGHGNFPSLYPFPGTYGASGAVLQDMNFDRKPDLLISSLLTARVSLVKNISR